MKQCEKIAQEIIESMYFEGFINQAEVIVYIYNVNGKICTQKFKKVIEPSTYEDILNKKEYQIENLCESYFCESPFGRMLHVPDEKELAKRIYNYKRNEVLKMTYKTRFQELEKVLTNIIQLDDKILTNHLEEMDSNEFYQRLLDERNYFTTVINIMRILEESETKEELYQNLIKENYMPERSN